MPASVPLTVLIANPSPDVYGSDLQMLESVSAMTAAGWRVIVAIPSDGDLVPRLRSRGADIRFVDFPVLRRSGQSLWAFVKLASGAVRAVFSLRKAIKQIAPDVVYVNTVTLPWWSLASKLAKTPSVCHLHEAETTDRMIVRRALMTPLRWSDAVVVISRSTYDAMLEVVPALRDRAHIIYNGVPQPPEAPTPPKRDAPWQLAVVARLSPRKAPHLALEATAQLRSQGRDVNIELCGSAFEGYEWYVDELEARAAQPDLAGAVRFAGYTSPIWPALARADIVVAPSLREPFGNAVVEAQLAGRPVVATAALGHLESITDGETGLLVPAGDVTALATAVAQLMDDEDLSARISDDARRTAIARFGTERYSREIVDLLRATATEG